MLPTHLNLYANEYFNLEISLGEEFHSDFQHLYVDDRLSGNYNNFSAYVTTANLYAAYQPFKSEQLSLEYNADLLFVKNHNQYSCLDNTITAGSNLLSSKDPFFIDTYLNYHFVFENFRNSELLYSDISANIIFSFDNGDSFVPSLDIKYLRYLSSVEKLSHLKGNIISAEPGVTLYGNIASGAFSFYAGTLIEFDFLRDQVAYMINDGKLYIGNSYFKPGIITSLKYEIGSFLFLSKINYFYFLFLDNDYLVANGSPKGRRKDHFINISETISYDYKSFSFSIYYKFEKLISNYSDSAESYIHYGFTNNITGLDIAFTY